MVIVELILQRNSTLRAAYTEGTKKNISTHWEAYLEFCDIFQESQIQATVESLSLFIQHISNRLKTAGSVANYLSGVKTMHIINDLDTSIFDDYLIKMMVRGVKMQKGHNTKKAAPITVEILICLRPCIMEPPMI